MPVTIKSQHIDLCEFSVSLKVQHRNVLQTLINRYFGLSMLYLCGKMAEEKRKADNSH